MVVLRKIWTLLRHGWKDEGDTQRCIPPDMAQRLADAVAASEQGHRGQIRLCVEAGLPASYVWRMDAHTPMSHLTRQRAVMMFSKLRVWDTEHNSGVLIYLLLAEHAIEIVADRGLTRAVSDAQWQDIVARLAASLAAQHYEAGLTQAVEETTALLKLHFPLTHPTSGSGNELPNPPHLQ